MKWLLVALYVARLADLTTTEMGLAIPRVNVSELNPLAQHKAVRVGMAIALPFVVYKLSGAPKKPKLQAGICAVTIAAWTFAAIKNYQLYRHKRRIYLEFYVSF